VGARFFHLTRPTPQLASGVGAGAFSYPDVGATNGPPPTGWPVDRRVGDVGIGQLDYEQGRALIDSLAMFDQDWLHLMCEGPPSPGKGVVFASWQFGLWSLNACRVVYMIDETTETHSTYGFAYGTLEDHAVAGEERFSLRWNRQTDRVTFEVYKFSRLRHPLVVLAGPVARIIQRRFSDKAIARIRRGILESEHV
jgi:uncharacterized protein (UPF0548 family)